MKTHNGITIAGLLLALVLTTASGHARAATTLEMAYMPIVPCSQLFVIEGMGWAKEAGINLELTRFSNGPAIVQAIASGEMDTMCFGIGPAMVTRGKGIELKVIGAGIVEQIAVIAQGDLVKYFDEHPNSAAALRAFTKDKGRKPKIASFPKGSVPDTVTRHWILRSMGMSLDEVELVGMGASRVQQALGRCRRNSRADSDYRREQAVGRQGRRACERNDAGTAGFDHRGARARYRQTP
jgi:NitT/TauT family transport system substrate-binding protein